MYRGIRYYVERKYDKAISDLTEAFRVAPKAEKETFARAFVYRAHCRYELGEFAKAISDLKEVVSVAPKDSLGHSTLAQFLATCPDDKLRDGRKAVEAATEACKLERWNQPQPLEALAAAYAECRKFDDAIKWQKKAIDILEGQGLKTSGGPEEKRLKLYEAHKPMRCRSIADWVLPKVPDPI
jgi:serine/threonine-protein kinase